MFIIVYIYNFIHASLPHP